MSEPYYDPMDREDDQMTKEDWEQMNAANDSRSFEERWAEHLRLTAENAPPLNPQGKPDWMHPDFDRCSNDWWRLELCQHCHADGGCKAHFAKRFPTLFPDNFPAMASRPLKPTNTK